MRTFSRRLQTLTKMGRSVSMTLDRYYRLLNNKLKRRRESDWKRKLPRELQRKPKKRKMMRLRR